MLEPKIETKYGGRHKVASLHAYNFINTLYQLIIKLIEHELELATQSKRQSLLNVIKF